VLGLELQDSKALAVAIDDQGRIRARALVDASDGLAAAAAAVLAKVAMPAEDGPLGVATFNPDAPALVEALAALSGRDARSVMPAGAAAAVAEAWVGAASGVKHVAYFAAAEHTAAGIIRDGHVMLGSHGRASSVAWLALNPVEREDYRKIGCLEAEVAAAGIVRRLVWRVKAGDHSRVAEIVDNDFAKITAEHVLIAARDGDGVSISVMRDTAKYLGMAAANLVLLADPEVLVLGGLMADAADLLLEPVRAEIARRLPRPMLDALTIVPATLGADAAAIGAARHAASARR
jgi:glucokinase